MKPDNPQESLLERGLAAWEVPEPAADLTDRILAHNADAIEALSRPLPETPTEAEETPAMLPTEPRTTSSLRPFWTATLLGFAAAAALLLAFAAGRQSSRPSELQPSTPQVEINVTAPVAAPVPPTPEVEPEPEPERVIIEETTTPPDIEDDVTKPESPTRARSKRKRRQHSSELKNPFEMPDLKDPLAADATEDDAVLRVGTRSGVAPAEVYVDGKHVGKTPLAKLVLEPGSHTVEFVWANGRRQLKKVTIRAGGTAVVRGG